MSYQCAICHKKAMRGNLVSHSKQRTHRSFKPNLHKVTVILAGVKQSLRVCTKCLRRLKKPFVKKEIAEQVKAAVPLKQEMAKMPEETKVKEVKVKTTTIEELMKETQVAEEKASKDEEEKKAVKKTATPKKPKKSAK
ncbi:50S ribosomal protein L28 [Candidatus Microgenomates bacterium]|nr:50S ribosomal protein L28 [Candidatus Microgenomates bacterium]